jgi:hypothetical protein
MKHTTFASIRFLTLSALMAGVSALHAAGPIKVPWNDLCKVAQGRQLTITLANGETAFGYCTSVNADEISLASKDKKVVKVARSALRRVQMYQSTNNGHQLSALGRGVHKGLGQGADWLLSPYAPLGIVTVPATLAWGAVAAPFCIISDLIHEDPGTQEIEVL